jgi:hypothetical protein
MNVERPLMSANLFEFGTNALAQGLQHQNQLKTSIVGYVEGKLAASGAMRFPMPIAA